MADEKLELLNCLVQSCMLPKLRMDFDFVPLDENCFSEYHGIVQRNLPQIYEFLRQEEEWLFCQIDESTLKDEKIQAKAKLIIMLCELTGPAAVYKLEDNGVLLKNADNLITRYSLRASGDDLITKFILDYYCTALNTKEFKRNLGAIHGFVKFISDYLTDKSFCLRWTNFALAVAITLRECPGEYKHLGIKTFLVLLEKTNRNDIRSSNIHAVVYSNVLKDVHYMESAAVARDIWQCLYECLDYFDNITSLEWSQVDDLIEVLIRNIPLTSNTQISMVLLEFLTKLCYYFTLNRQEIKENLWLDLTEPDNFEKCFDSCKAIACFTGFRWAKNILELLRVESYKIMQDTKTSARILLEMHRCYMACIVPIPMETMETLFSNFLDKFIAILLEAIALHQKDMQIVRLTKVFCKTFKLQLLTTTKPLDEQNIKIRELKKALDGLMTHPVFL